MKMLIRVLVAWCLIVFGVYAEEVVVAKDAVIIPDLIGIDTIDKEINTYFVRPCVMEWAKFISDYNGTSIGDEYKSIRRDNEMMETFAELVEAHSQGKLFEWNRRIEDKSPEKRLEAYQEWREECESTVRWERIKTEQGYD